MRKKMLVGLAFGVMAIFAINSNAHAVPYNITQLTNNAYIEDTPRLNNNGQVVWQRQHTSGIDLLLYNGSTTTNLTNTGYNQHQQINDNGQVVWSAGGDIVLYDGSTTSQLTNNNFDNRFAQINNNGQVVWSRLSGGVFFYNGSTTTLANSGNSPYINNSGQVVWSESDGNDSEVFLFDGSNTTQLTDNTIYDHVEGIADNGHIVWSANNDIFMSEENTINQITNNNDLEYWIGINAIGQVVWNQSGEMFLYNGSTNMHLNNSFGFGPGQAPQVNDNGQVTWFGYDGNDYEIFLFDGLTTSQITNNDYNDFYPQINNLGQIAWYANDEIFLANPVPEPASLLLLGSGLIGMLGYGKKRKFKV